MTEEDRELNVYDPFDVELQHLKMYGFDEIQLDYTNPSAAKFLSHQLTVRLLELRETKLAIDSLRSNNQSIRDNVEDLRVLNAHLTEKNRFSWLEFPAGILCGIAGNLITSNKSDYFAWFLLTLGIFIFFIIRYPLPIKVSK